MSLEQAFLSYTSLVCAQVIFYDVSMRQALKSYWFLGFFYFLIFSCVQGLILFCDLFSVSFFVIPLACLLNSFFLKNGLRRVPQFNKRYFTLPNFYLLSSLWLSLVWAGYLLNQTVLTAKYNLIEAFIWSWFSAILFPILAGIKERIGLMEVPPGFSATGIFFVAVGIVVLALSFF